MPESSDCEIHFDIIIVGAGPAGCVLANRLSECPDKHVLLIEAGPDLARPGLEDPELIDPFAPIGKSNPALRFPGITAQIHDGGETLPFVQGYGVGGGSNINGMCFDRGLPEDFDEWEAAGISGWGWRDVLPYFRKLECDAENSGPNASKLHGTNGPVPVRRTTRLAWPPFTAALCEAAERRGLPYLEDYTGDFREGFAAAPTNEYGGRRISAALAYLDADVRLRPNLTIHSGARVDRVLFEALRVTGVEADVAGIAHRFRAPEVILTAGALRTPALLLHSGIGPARQLSRLGIPVRLDRAGVGANLQNHPFLALACYLPREARQSADDHIFIQNWMRRSSELPGMPDKDMHILMVNKADWHAIGRRVGSLVISIFKPCGAGSVTLASAAPAEAPRVAFNLLGDERDVVRLKDGLRFGAELLLDAGVRAVRGEAFIPDGRIIRRLSRRTLPNRIMARVLAAILDITPLRKLALSRSTIDLESLASSDRARETFLRKYLQVQFHVACTCRMGSQDDPTAVVDSDGRVYGVDGLRVADTSIFPSIPRGCTHAIVMMTGEKIADSIKRDWSAMHIDARGRPREMAI